MEAMTCAAEAIGTFAGHSGAVLVVALGSQRFLDHAQAEQKAEVEPDRVADELGRKAVAGVRRLGG